MQDDRKIFEKILFGTEKMTRADNKITLCKIRFNLSASKNLSQAELKLHNFVNIWMVEDGLQNLDSSTCGIFQLCFYDNLFNLDKNSKIQKVLCLN